MDSSSKGISRVPSAVGWCAKYVAGHVPCEGKSSSVAADETRVTQAPLAPPTDETTIDPLLLLFLKLFAGFVLLIYTGSVVAKGLSLRAARRAKTLPATPAVRLEPRGFPYAALVHVYGLEPALAALSATVEADVLVGADPANPDVAALAERLSTLATQPPHVGVAQDLGTALVARCVGGMSLKEALDASAGKPIATALDARLLWQTAAAYPANLSPATARAHGHALLDATADDVEARQRLLRLASTHRWPLPAHRLAEAVLKRRPPRDPRPLVAAITVSDRAEAEPALIDLALAYANDKSTAGSAMALASLEALRRHGGPTSIVALTPLLSGTTMLIRATAKQTLEGLHRRLGDQAGELSMAHVEEAGRLSEPV